MLTLNARRLAPSDVSSLLLAGCRSEQIVPRDRGVLNPLPAVRETRSRPVVGRNAGMMRLSRTSLAY
jgi:hypothetical protein